MIVFFFGNCFQLKLELILRVSLFFNDLWQRVWISDINVSIIKYNSYVGTINHEWGLNIARMILKLTQKYKFYCSSKFDRTKNNNLNNM